MGTADIALERVQALLKVDTGSGSLYNHISRVVQSLAADKPQNALHQVETLSRHLKQATFRGTVGPDEPQPIVVDAEAEERRRQWCGNSLQLLRPPSDPASAPRVLCAVQNFMQDSAMFEWAGVGFGRQESFLIAMSLRKLATDTPALEKLRLWGKVLGTNGDYYVAEGRLEALSAECEQQAMPNTPEYDVDPRGEGTNAFTYWVSACGSTTPSGGSSSWVRLPAARASQICASRRIKRLLTGDLSSEVFSMPWFPGTERHLLRSQIARITSTCTLAVSGYYEPAEEKQRRLKDAIKEVEGFVAEGFPSHEDLNNQSSWVHCAPFLFSTGKTTWPEIDDLIGDREIGDEAKEVLEGVIANIGEKLPREAEKGELLESIENDLKGEDSETSPAWSIQVYGDKGLYTEESGPKSHRVTAVRSQIWPGAITVAQGTRFANIYIGYATKCGTLVPPSATGEPLEGTSPFMPLVPDAIMDEPTDLKEQDEPNPEEPEVEEEKEGEEGEDEES